MSANLFDAFRIGARQLAGPTRDYANLHAEHGLTKPEWDLLVQNDPWNVEQRRQAKSTLSECLQISLTLAGLPAMALPGQYVAACIVEIVSPVNRLVAAAKAPEAYDAVMASGLETEESEIRPISPEQMISMVIAFSGFADAQPADQLDDNLQEHRRLDEDDPNSKQRSKRQ